MLCGSKAKYSLRVKGNNMQLKKIITFSISLMLVLVQFGGCGSTENSASSTPDSSSSEEISENGRIPTPKKYLMDDFNYTLGGFTESSFYINENRWGANNNGVRGANVGYTEDGIAVLKAYGDYAKNPSDKRSGSCLLSQEYIGPGKIEVAMKVMPRLGGCTAIWPFYAGQNEQSGEYQYQEFDIEIPAGADNINPATFERVMNTSYANTWNEITGGPSRTTKTETLTPANDGAWHKYGMEWETSPKPRIRYYVDDVLTSDTDDDPNGYKTVSDATAPIQIGVWFPNGWAGDRNFDEACALIDWVSYQPYPDQPRKESKKPEFQAGLYPMENYPMEPIELPVTEYIGNGDFENMTDKNQEGQDMSIWQGDFSFEDLVETENGGHALNLAAGKSISQVITGVYGKDRTDDAVFGNLSYYYDFTLIGNCDTTAGKGTVKVEFLDDKGAPLGNGAITSALADLSSFKLNPQSVHGSKAMKITISVTEGNIIFDDISMSLTDRI